MVTTIATIGSTVRTVEYMDFNFTLWAVGGQDKFCLQWRHYNMDTNYLIHVVDSDVRDRVEEAKTKLNKLMNEDEMRDAVALVMFPRSHHKRQLGWESL